MPEFFRTVYTIADGRGMGTFSSGHFLWLALTVFLVITLGRSYGKSDQERRKRMRLILGIMIILDEIAKDVMTVSTGQWAYNFLPLHLCSISVFVSFFHSLTDNRTAAEYLYAVTLPTASMALVFPDWTGRLPFLSFMCIHSFSIHMILVVYSSLQLFAGFVPSWKYLRMLIVPIVIYWCAMYGVNRALGTNFAFMNGGASGSPLSFLEVYIGGWYRLAFPVIALICWLPMYLIPRKIMNKKI